MLTLTIFDDILSQQNILFLPLLNFFISIIYDVISLNIQVINKIADR